RHTRFSRDWSSDVCSSDLATICTPANPKCNSCPFNDNCFAFSKNHITSLPVKTKKIKVKDRFLNYMILQSENEVALQQRTDKDRSEERRVGKECRSREWGR